MRTTHVAGTIIVVLAFFFVATPSQAAPIPLASLSFANTVGFATSGNQPDGMSFTLDYNSPPADCAGCGVIYALGTTGTFDFNSSNDLQFGGLVAHLTNGIDETIANGMQFDFGSSFLGGTASVPFEFSVFPGNTDLVGHTIDFVRLEILSNVISQITIDNLPGVQSAFSVKWTIFGDDPSAGAVPEPGTLVLLGSGVLAAVLARRRRQVP